MKKGRKQDKSETIKKERNYLIRVVAGATASAGGGGSEELIWLTNRLASRRIRKLAAIQYASERNRTSERERERNWSCSASLLFFDLLDFESESERRGLCFGSEFIDGFFFRTNIYRWFFGVYIFNLPLTNLHPTALTYHS